MNVKLYGNWKRNASTPEGSARGMLLEMWLAGEPVIVTSELVALLREEFTAQEQFRAGMVHHFARLADHLSALSTPAAERLEMPSDPQQAYEAGYRAGAYSGYTTAAQQVRAALSEVTAEVAVDGLEAAVAP